MPSEGEPVVRLAENLPKMCETYHKKGKFSKMVRIITFGRLSGISHLDSGIARTWAKLQFLFFLIDLYNRADQSFTIDESELH